MATGTTEPSEPADQLRQHVPGRDSLGRYGDRIVWAAFVVLAAICGAGMVMTLDHPEDDAGRPELTAVGDAIVEPRLAALAPALYRLSADADAISRQARDVYARLRALDVDGLRAGLSGGDAALAKAQADLAPVEALRAHLLDGITPALINQRNREQVMAAADAAAAATQLGDAWAPIRDAASRAGDAVDWLDRHDAAVVTATARARETDWTGALDQLVAAATALDSASRVADDAASAGLDTSTLGAVIDRDGTYDDALRALYMILETNGGVMTDEAQGAYRQVQAAQAALPNNGSAMTLIVSDLGGQQVTLGLIELDQLRGTIGAAAPPSAAASPR